MPPIREKRKNKSKKKNSKVSEDADKLFLKSLDEKYYLPKQFCNNIVAKHLKHINAAIDVFALPTCLTKEENITIQRNQQRCYKIETCLPMTLVPLIVRSLGFVPTEQQLRQILWLVLFDNKSQINNNFENVNNEKSESFEKIVTKSEVTLEMIMQNSLESLVANCVSKEQELLADRKKLENVLLNIFRTGLLVFDPVNNNNETSTSSQNRLISVMSHNKSTILDDVFDIIWLNSNREISKDGTRFIFADDLRRLIKDTTYAYANSEPPMTSEELDIFFSHVCDVGCDMVDENAFAFAAM